MSKDISSIWLCGIYDPGRDYGILLHAGTENQVRMTYDAMTRGARSSGLNTHCLKLLAPGDWQAIVKEKYPGGIEAALDQLLNGTIGFNKLF